MDIKEKINLKRLNSILKKNTLTIIILVILFAIGGYFYSFNFAVPKYKSSSTILLVSKNSNEKNSKVTQNDVTLNKSLLATYGNIITSNNVLEKVIENLQIDMTAEELSKNVKIEEVEDTQLLKVDVISKSAVEAQKIAEEINNVFVQEIKSIYNMENVTVVDKASLEEEPYNINHIRDIILFAILGIGVSGVVVIINYIFDTSIKLEQDIEDFAGINVIGTVPKSKEKKELIVNNNIKSTVSEAFKAIRTNIEFTNNKKISKSILFTSCNSGEGKSWITSNIAVAYAQADKNVIIVDSDMRKGRQHQIFNVDNKLGLSNCLNEMEESEKDYAILEKYIKETPIAKVHIMTIGTVPPNPSELLLSSKMEYLIKMLKKVYDIVIIDGTPCNLVSDSIPVSRMVDSTVIVTESKRTKIEDLKQISKLIKNAKGNIVGAILNKKELKRKEYGKGYYYGNSQDMKQTIELERKSVSELIANRKENIEEVKYISENDTKLDLLSKRIEDLEDLLLEIPDLTLNNYNKIVEEVKQVYTNEMDKEALAEKIKNDIIKKELIEELKKTTGNTEEVIDKKLQELDNKEDVEKLINKINDIELLIKNDATQESIIEKIEEMRIEQNKKIDMLDSSKILNNIVIQMQRLNKKYENIERIENIISSNKTQETIIQKMDEIQREQSSKIDKLDSSRALNNIVIQMQKLNSKYENIQNIEELINNDEIEIRLNERLNELQEEQNRRIRQLDNTRELNNIIIEMQDLNRKYNKVQSLEKAITNDKTEERINKMIEKMKKDNDKKLEKIDNTAAIKEIMKELKKINVKYDKMAEKIAKNNTNTRNTTSNKTKPKKDNIIEITELKDKLNKQELVIEFGKEIEYEQLLNTAIDTYEIKPNKKSKKA